MTDRFGDLPLEADLTAPYCTYKSMGTSSGVESIKKPKSRIEVRLSPEGTAQTDGAKLVSESMEFGRAVGFSMEDGQLIMTCR